MAKKPKSYGKNTKIKKQLSYYDRVVQEQAIQEEKHKGGTFDIDTAFREALKDATTESGKKGLTIAYEMSELLGVEITESKLSSYITKNAYYFPAKYLGAFCKVTGSSWPIQIIAKQLGLFIMESPEALFSEIAKIDEEITELRTAKKNRRILLKQLKGRNG